MPLPNKTLSSSQTLYRSPLARQLIFYVVLFSSVLTLLSTAFQFYQEYDRDVNLIEDQLQQLEEVHLKSLTQSLWVSDRHELKVLLEGIFRLPGMRFIEVRDDDQVWASLGVMEDEDVMSRHYPMVYPHRGQNLQIGRLTVVASLSEVYQRLIDKVWWVLITNGVKTFLVSGFILLLFHRLIARHLLKIGAFAQTLDLDTLDHSFVLDRKRSGNTQPDELDDLVQAIHRIGQNIKASLSALEESENRLQILSQVLPFGLFQTNALGECLSVNERWTVLSGLSEEEAEGYGWMKALHRDDRERVIQEWNIAVKGNFPFQSEYRFRRPDGETTWLLAQSEVVRDQDRKIKGYVGIVTDIDERKRMEETVRHIAEGVSAQVGKAFFTSLVLHLCKMLDVKYAFIGVLDQNNLQEVESLAFCVGGKVGDNIRYNLKDTPCFDVVRKKVCAFPTGVQARFPKDLALVRMGVESYVGIPLLGKGDKPLGLLSVLGCHAIKNIQQVVQLLSIFATRASVELQRLEVEKALKESEQRLNDAQSMLHIGNWDFDLTQNKLTWSDEIYHIFELPHETFSVSYEAFLNAIHPEDRQAVQEAYDTSLKNKMPYNLEHRLRMSDGRIKYVQERCLTYFDTKGQALRSMGTIQDITERVDMEEALRRSLKMDAVGRLSGGIAHDFNNQLGVIIGYLDFLKRDILEEKQQKWVETASRATLRCIKLTRQLLSFSRKQRKEEKVVNLNAVLKELEAVISHALTPEVAVRYVFSENLHLTKMDPGEFQDALLNLVINARDAMPGGGHLSIETRNVVLDGGPSRQHSDLEPGAYVELVVSDTGTGIEKEVLDHIFEPFFTTKPAEVGTGMGMAMVYGFVKRSGGEIRVYSELGSGTQMLVHLPRALEEESPTLVHVAKDVVLPQGVEGVLIVDDEPDLLKLAELYLKELGYCTKVAGNGAEALEILDDDKMISVLFSDVVMPGGLNGYDLARKARLMRPNLKVLLTTGFTTKGLNESDAIQPEIHILTKPYRKESLAKRIREVLDEEKVAEIN